MRPLLTVTISLLLCERLCHQEEAVHATLQEGCLSDKSLKGVDIEKEPVFNSGEFFPLPFG